jgi:hypothetical protein
VGDGTGGLLFSSDLLILVSLLHLLLLLLEVLCGLRFGWLLLLCYDQLIQQQYWWLHRWFHP